MSLGDWTLDDKRGTFYKVLHMCSNKRHGFPVVNRDGENIECIRCHTPVPQEIKDVIALKGITVNHFFTIPRDGV